jgi:hypothetical protein
MPTLFFDKGPQKTISSTKVAGKNGISACRKLKLDLFLSTCTSITQSELKTLMEDLKI